MRKTYSKISKTGVSSVIKDFEIVAILSAEKGEGEWKELKTKMGLNPASNLKKTFANLGNRIVWGRSDGALALLKAGDMMMHLELPSASEYEAAQKRLKEEKERMSVPEF